MICLDKNLMDALNYKELTYIEEEDSDVFDRWKNNIILLSMTFFYETFWINDQFVKDIEVSYYENYICNNLIPHFVNKDNWKITSLVAFRAEKIPYRSTAKKQFLRHKSYQGDNKILRVFLFHLSEVFYRDD